MFSLKIFPSESLQTFGGRLDRRFFSLTFPSPSLTLVKLKIQMFNQFTGIFRSVFFTSQKLIFSQTFLIDTKGTYLKYKKGTFTWLWEGSSFNKWLGYDNCNINLLQFKWFIHSCSFLFCKTGLLAELKVHIISSVYNVYKPIPPQK